MSRSRNLLRDYGLSLGLVAASVLLFWKTMVPQLRKNRILDEALLERLEQRRETEQEIERLRLLERSNWDPLVTERMSRELFGDLGLPEGETLLPTLED